MSMRLKGRRILITGAASGIGRATAELFASEGAELALLDRTADALASVAERISAQAFVVDLSDRDAIRSTVETAADALAGLDGIVNVAGISLHKLMENTSDSEWDAVVAVNLSAPFLIMRAALQYLKKASSPTIVNVASGTALMPTLSGHSIYAATKGGLVTLSKALAYELAL